MSDAKHAEQLWLKAHEEVKKGNLAQAVRDLASCYEMLKALKDPRLAQVHRRWVEVHKLFLERKAKAQAQPRPQAAAPRAAAPQAAASQAAASQAAAPQVQAQPAPAAQVAQRPASEPVRAEPRFSSADARTLGEEAEAAANDGKLQRAIELYERVLQGAPSNELAKERVTELKAALARAGEMSGAQARPLAVAQPTPPVVAAKPAHAPTEPDASIAFLEGLLKQVQERRRAV